MSTIKLYSLDLALEASSGNLDKVKELINQGFDVHYDDDRALIWAAMKGHLDVVKYLVSVGAYVNTDDNLAIKLARVNGHLHIAKYLIKMGADPNACSGNNDHNTVRQGLSEVEQFFILCKRNDKLSKNLVKIMLKDV